jgi:hypothetical protein
VPVPCTVVPWSGSAISSRLIDTLDGYLPTGTYLGIIGSKAIHLFMLFCSSRFLADIGVPADSIGDVLTRAPSLLEQDHEDLKTRLAYLISKRFAAEQIAHIVTQAPRWLCFAVKGIDGRLGYFQKTFGLTGISYLSLERRIENIYFLLA